MPDLSFPDLSLEEAFHAQGHRLVAGVDEAGRGPLAGPVAAAAVIIPPDASGDEEWLAIIDDSKRLTARQRESAAHLIRQNALASAVRLIPPDEIDRIGIGAAVLRAMFDALASLRPQAEAVLFDWVPLKQCPVPHQTIARGDGKSLSIAAASILAKVARDEHMVCADRRYPGYGFARHKGYATALHLRCLEEMGPTPIHRRSFNPLRQGRLIHNANR